MEAIKQEDDVRRLRHSLRGSVNAMKLGITVLEIGLPAGEAAEFLTYIEDAAASVSSMLDDYEAALEKQGPADVQPTHA